MSVLIADCVKEINKHKVWESTERYNELLFPNYQFVTRKIERYGKKAKSVLDVGTAYGVLALACAKLGKEVLAVDNTDRYTPRDYLKKQGVSFKLWDIEKTEYKQGKYDLVLMTEVLEHLNHNPLKPMQRLVHLMNEGGIFILTTPCYETQGPAPGKFGLLLNWKKIPEGGTPEVDEHTHHYSMPELISLFDAVGLKILEFGRCYGEMSNYIIAQK